MGRPWTHYVTARDFQIIVKGERITAWRFKCSCGHEEPAPKLYFTDVDELKRAVGEHQKLNEAGIKVETMHYVDRNADGEIKLGLFHVKDGHVPIFVREVAQS